MSDDELLTPTYQDGDSDLPSLEEIDARREQLGVKKMHLSLVVGYSSGSGLDMAMSRDAIYPSKLRRMVWALDHVEEHGYLPLPEEYSDD